MKNRLLNRIIFLVPLFLLASCVSRSIVVKPGYDFRQIKRVAVLDFRSTTYRPNTGTMASELFMKYLLPSNYDVIERAELESLLREQNLSLSGLLNREQVKQLGKISGVDAIITGTISVDIPEQYFYESSYTRFVAAQAGITCRMISVETGEVLWAASDTYDGMNTQTAFDYLISSLVRDLMKELARK